MKSVKEAWDNVLSLLGLKQPDLISGYVSSRNVAPSQDQFGRLSYYLPTGGQTATGTNPVSGYTAAVSRELLDKIPMGTLIKLPNGQVVRVEDLTSKDIKDTLDLFYSKPEEANYPEQGLMKNVPYDIVGRSTEGLRYNY